MKPIDLTDKRNSYILDLLMEKEIIGRVSNYLKQVPVLMSASIWYSPNKTFSKGRSQEYHLDSDDKKQVKLLIPFKEVTIETGPFTIISKKESDKIHKNLKKYDCKKIFGSVIQNQKFGSMKMKFCSLESIA